LIVLHVAMATAMSEAVAAKRSEVPLHIDRSYIAVDAVPSHGDLARAGLPLATGPFAASLPKLLEDKAPHCAPIKQNIVASWLVMPVAGAYISSPFGIRVDPAQRELRKHTGVDLAAPVGTPVKASDWGTVESVGYDKRGYGRYVVLRHAAGYSTWYAHLSAFAANLRAGMRIHTGELVGKVGRTGDATGPHLHFEVRLHGEPIDPVPLMRGRVFSTFVTRKSADILESAPTRFSGAELSSALGQEQGSTIAEGSERCQPAG
jgi:murein DD-endopeptidase MepM/ murein hydrolase activator NlpD